MKPSSDNFVLYIGVVRYIGREKGGDICDYRLWYTVIA